MSSTPAAGARGLSGRAFLMLALATTWSAEGCNVRPRYDPSLLGSAAGVHAAHPEPPPSHPAWNPVPHAPPPPAAPSCGPLTTLANCGACSARCALPGARVSCAAGFCQLIGCQRHRGDCDGWAGNGCETRLLESIDHCGGCGASCRFLPGAVASSCEDGECEILSCAYGYDDCDGEIANGCEQPLGTPSHCGACEDPCPGPHAYGHCQGIDQCFFAGCHPGFARCGHECVSLSSSENCGACGVQCPRGTRCQGGRCL